MNENNQIVNQVKSILTPPNWENEGKNESLNKEYKALMDKYFGSYIEGLNNPEYTDAAILKFATKDEGYQAAFNIFKGGKTEYAQSGKNNIGLNLIKNNENVILEIHGSKEGKVAYGGYTFKTNEIIQRLEDTGLIPKGTKQIYTMSCYGGLQEKGLTASGIPFESSHTSLEPTIGYNEYDIYDNINDNFKESFQHSVDFDKSQLEDYTRRLEEEKKELNTLKNEHPDWTDFIQYKESNVENYQKYVDFYKKELTKSEERLQKKIDYITKSNNKKSTLVNLTKSGNTTDKYKQDVLDSFKKHGDNFAKAEFIAEPKEIENALWYLISQDKHESKLKDIEEYTKLIEDYKHDIQITKSGITYYEKGLQKAKESNNIEDIEEYTEHIEEYKKDIKEDKKKIKEYSTIAYKDKLQLQEFDEKDRLYGKDYKAKSNFVSNQVKYLTPQEAFDKYGPDDDKFYTSQGLDPKEQRAKINELNSKRKPVLSNEEILEQLHKETEEAAEQFYNTAEEIKNSLDNISNQLEDIKPEPKKEPTIKTDTNTEQTVKNTIEDIKPNTKKLENKIIAETANNTNKLENRTIQDTAKKSLNTKKLGIAIAGATIAVAGITAMASSSKKKKDKEEYINKANNINTNTNNSYIDYSNDLQYAKQIISYSRGHSTYSL